ncbi:MAG: alpha/beta hydrolase [Eubacteriales bacterium]
MEDRENNRKISQKMIKIMRNLCLAMFALGILSFCGLCIYASDYRTLEEEYFVIFEQDNIQTQSDLIYFEGTSDLGLIFYPGGRVEHIAYTPFCQKLQDMGLHVFLVDMPFNMANFGVNKANNIMKEYSDISEWYIGGHSLGGVAANMYASSNAEKISGLILVGIYLSMDYDMEKTITINGSNDLRVGDSVDYTTNVHVISGGNHAQFGNYGENSGDGEASITADQQQNQAVSLITEFMELKSS